MLEYVSEASCHPATYSGPHYPSNGNPTGRLFMFGSSRTSTTSRKLMDFPVDYDFGFTATLMSGPPTFCPVCNHETRIADFVNAALETGVHDMASIASWLSGGTAKGVRMKLNSCPNPNCPCSKGGPQQESYAEELHILGWAKNFNRAYDLVPVIYDPAGL
jgi:hypothetical protein